jgi:hypothetical protein
VRTRASLLLLALAVLAVSPRDARAAEVQVVRGPRVEVRSTVADPETATVARDLLEKALVVIETALPYRVPAGQRLVANLHATEEEYSAAVLAQGGSEGLARRWAATMYKTAESHVLVQPRCDPVYLARVGHLPEFTRFLLCHEAVHQVHYLAKAPGHHWWPTWYDEGTPNLLAERCLLEGKAAGAAPPIHVDDNRHLRAHLLTTGRALRLDRLLAADDAHFDDVRALYAQSTEFVRMLAADDVRFRLLHERIRDLPLPPLAEDGGDRGVRHAAACARALEAVYGPLDALAKRWRTLSASSPRWFEQWRSSEVLGDAVVTAAFPDGTALLLSAAPPPAGPFTFTAEVEILPIGKRQADVILAYEDRLDPRFLKVSIGAAGYASLLAYADGAWHDRYKRNADVPMESVPVETPIPVTVEVGRDVIRLFLRGTRVLEAPVPPGFDAVGGGWGLAARDTVALWTKVAVTKAPAPSPGSAPKGK